MAHKSCSIFWVGSSQPLPRRPLRQLRYWGKVCANHKVHARLVAIEREESRERSIP